MAQMVVRDLDDDVRDRLRERAKAHGRSMEAEVREILTAAALTAPVLAEPGLGTRIVNLFADVAGDDIESDWHGTGVRPVAFDE